MDSGRERLYEKSVYLTFVFDLSVISQITLSSEDKTMVDAHGWYISAVFQDCQLCGCLEVGYIYICHSVGFCIVRLDDKGNARA